jgi:hypothetical protein
MVSINSSCVTRVAFTDDTAADSAQKSPPNQSFLGEDHCHERIRNEKSPTHRQSWRLAAFRREVGVYRSQSGLSGGLGCSRHLSCEANLGDKAGVIRRSCRRTGGNAIMECTASNAERAASCDNGDWVRKAGVHDALLVTGLRDRDARPLGRLKVTGGWGVLPPSLDLHTPGHNSADPCSSGQ